MQNSITLTASLGDYDLHQSLFNGQVQPKGINLIALPMHSQERHWRLLRHHEFEVAELSLSYYLSLRNQLEKHYIAIPVFPHRRFRHSFIFINPNKNISQPKDLNGGRVGLRTWQATGGVWQKGILQEEYGVDLKSIEWITQDEEDLEIEMPQDFSIKRVQAGKDVDQMLIDGELDALIYPDMPKTFLSGNPNITRLFQNFKEEEMKYFEKTKIFPIMHTVVIREDILEKFPWVAKNIMEAFKLSQRDAWKRMEDPRTISLAWVREIIEEQHQILGKDPWPIGLDPNYKTIEALVKYSKNQGILKDSVEIKDLFFHSTLDEPPHVI